MCLSLANSESCIKEQEIAWRDIDHENIELVRK